MDRGIRIEDVAGLKSRVSWGAIIGGSLIALAAYVILGLFFAGVGLSLTEAGVRNIFHPSCSGKGRVASVIVTWSGVRWPPRCRTPCCSRDRKVFEGGAGVTTGNTGGLPKCMSG